MTLSICPPFSETNDWRVLSPAALQDGCLNVDTDYHTRFVGDGKEMVNHQLSCVLSLSAQIPVR